MKLLRKQVYKIIDECWANFIRQLSEGKIRISKEASMQLEFSYILKLALSKVHKHTDETVWVDLERAVRVKNRSREIDVVIEITKGKRISLIPIEMKCYRSISTSGGRRAAHDIFRHKVYEDIELLESYESLPNYTNGIQLTITDNKSMVFPKTKRGKSWTYDTAHGTRIKRGIKLNTPIGGKPVNLTLRKNYQFVWTTENNFHFLMLRGK
jgi:hypothetical protein